MIRARFAAWLRPKPGACVAGVCLAAATHVACTATTLKHVPYWKMSPSAPYFPENCTQGEAYCADFAHLKGRPVGVAFSGGGTRAATAALGQMRALHALSTGAEKSEAVWARLKDHPSLAIREDSWIARVRYLSAVSGGAWFSAIYTFLEGVEDTPFLGEVRRPSTLTASDLEHHNGRMEMAIDGSARFDHLFAKYFRRLGHESWARAIGDTFLAEFNLNQQRRIFSAGSDTRAQAAKSSGFEDDSGSIAIPRTGRPFLITGASLLSDEKLGNDVSDAQIFPLEVTPFYAGSAGMGGIQGQRFHQVGGGFLATYALDANTLQFGPNDAHGSIDTVMNRFTLSDLVGATSSAAVESIAHLPLVRPANVGFARYFYRSIDSRSSNYSPTYTFGDGAHLDNLGVISLLARGVDNVLVFVNTPRPLDVPGPSQDWWCDPKHEAAETKELLEQSGKLQQHSNYGLQPQPDPNADLGIPPEWQGDVMARAPLDLTTCSADASGCDCRSLSFARAHPQLFEADLRRLFGLDAHRTKTTVFDEKQFVPLMKGLQARFLNGGSAVYCDEYSVLPNAYFGVPDWQGKKANVCWVYLERDRNFLDEIADSQLPQNLLHALAYGDVPTPRFPHYNTVFQDGIQMIDLDEEEITALSNLTAFTLIHESEYIRQHLPGLQ